MADLEKTVSIIFSGKDDLSKVAQGVAGGIDGVAEAASSISAPLAGLTDKILAVDAALAAMAIGGLAVAVKSAGEFSDAFNEISTLIPGAAENVGSFKNDILDYSRDSVKSIEDINSAVYQAISSGVDYRDSLSLTKEAEKLAIAGKAGLTETVEGLIGTLNAYGAGTEKAGEYSDAFFKIVEKGKTTLPELNASLAQVTGIAAGAEIPFTTLGAAIAALTASGAPTSQAITGIKAAISNIIKPAETATETAAKLGIGFDASALKTKGFEGVMKEVYTATGGNIEVLGKLFGSTEALNVALVLGADKSGKFADALSGMEAKTGSVNAAYAKMAENFAAANQNIVNNLRATLIQAGMPLLDEYGDLAKSISSVFQSLGISIDKGAFNEVYKVIESFAGDVTQFLKGVAKALPEAFESVDFSKFVTALEGLGGSFGKIFEGIDLTTPEGLASAIQAVVDTVTSLTNVTAGIVGEIGPFIRQIVELAGNFNELDAGTQKTIGSTLGIGKIVNEITGYFDSLKTGLYGVVAGLAGIAGATGFGKVASVLAGSGAVFGGAAAAVLPLTAALAGAAGLGWAIGKVADWLNEKLHPALDAIPDEKTITIALEDQDALARSKNLVSGFEDTEIKLGISVEDKTPANSEGAKLAQLIAEGKTDFEIDYAMTGNVDSLKAALAESGVLVEKSLAETTKKVESMYVTLEDGRVVTIETPIDEKTLGETKKKVEELPTEKQLEIKLKGEIERDVAQIKATADTLEAAFKYRAEIDVARLQADARKVEAIANTIGEAFSSSAEIISGAFSILGDGNLSWADQRKVFDVIEREMELRREELEIQKELARVQIDLMTLKKEALERGEAAIKIEMEGVYPELEMIMWEVIKRVQIRANESASEFLLGIT